jgi:Rhs element Vgr protein
MADSPATGSDGVVTLHILSNGSETPSSVEVISVSVRKAVNRIPSAEIVLRDGDMPNKEFPVSSGDLFKPGAVITIKAGYGNTDEIVFEGVVVKHGIAINERNFSRLTVECRDKAIAMTIGRHNANFVDSKDSDIIKKVIGTYGGLKADTDATEAQHKEIVQYYCSDWDFILSRAEANGLVATIDAGKVSVKAPATSGSPSLKVTYGTDMFSFQASTDARHQYAKVQTVSWDLKGQAALQQQDGPESLNKQGNLDSATLAAVVSPAIFRLQTSAPLESAVLKSWAKGQQIKSGLARIQGRVAFQGNAKAKPGELLELEGVGDRFNGNVYIGSVHHSIRDGNWITEVEFGLAPDWFADQRDLVAPPASGLLPGIEGLHIGVVKKLDADPEGQYKIQVSVPVMQAETDGVWARLGGFYGSEGLGAFFVPEIGDEVILGFFNNDPSHPVILGSLYSSKRKPPYELTADNYKKALITRSKLTIEFDDEKKIVTIVTPAKNTVVIDDERKSILLQDETGNKVTLSTDGVLVDSPKDVVINAKGKIALAATGNVTIDSKGDITAGATNISHSAKAGFTAKGNATAELSASGQTTVKGSMVMIN